MPSSPDDAESVLRQARQFVTTHWTVVLAAAETDLASARDALTELCRTYWFPLYAYVRRQGHGPHDAEDLTQAFFARLLEKNFLEKVRRDRGKFRSFLLTALKRFLANEHERARAQKRGGRATVVSIDQASAETRYRLEPADQLTPEKIFEQRWAQTLLGKVLSDLGGEYAGSGKAGLFAALRDSLSRSRDSIPYARIGEQLGMSEAAVKMAATRLRARYRERLRQEIGKTVSSPEEVEEEIRHLFASFTA